jgi:hypothetical protein
VLIDSRQESPSRRRRFRRRPRDGEDGDDRSLPEMRAELVLLREENARLKAAEHEPSSFGKLLSRARAVAASPVAHEEFADEAVQALVEAIVLRDSLLEVCGELERSMARVKARLTALAEIGDDHAHLLAPRSHGSAVLADELSRE